MARGQQTEKKKKPIKYFDYSLLFLIIFLLCFGLVMLYSTSSEGKDCGMCEET